MSKGTLFLILLVQLSTKPSITDIKSFAAEVGIFLIAVMLGAGVRVAMKAQSRAGVSKKEASIIFFFGLSLGFIANYVMIYYAWDLPRPAIVWAVSMLAELILVQLEKKFPKIFDASFKKIGLDLKDKEKEHHE